MKKILLLIITLILFLTGCSNDNQIDFALIANNDSVIYQYQTKNSYLAEYPNFRTYNSIQDIEFSNFTIIVEDTKEISYLEYTEILNSDNKVILFLGDMNTISYKVPRVFYNFDLSNPDENKIKSKKVNSFYKDGVNDDYIFAYYCIAESKALIYDYMSYL